MTCVVEPGSRVEGLPHAGLQAHDTESDNTGSFDVTLARRADCGLANDACFG